MRRDIRCILLHTSELINIEEGIIYPYSFLFKEYRRSVFNKNGQATARKIGDNKISVAKANKRLSIMSKRIKCFN